MHETAIRPTMLLAEDDPDLLALHTLRFELEGYSVLPAANGAEALSILERREPPSVIVTDWMMRGVDGLRLCRHVRNQPQLDPMPVILLTAYAATVEVQQLIDAGGLIYVSKSTPWPELIGIINHHVRAALLQASAATEAW